MKESEMYRTQCPYPERARPNVQTAMLMPERARPNRRKKSSPFLPGWISGKIGGSGRNETQNPCPILAGAGIWPLKGGSYWQRRHAAAGSYY